MKLDSIQIGVTDVDDAARIYAELLGLEPMRLAGGARRFQLQRGAVELEAGASGLHAIRFVPEHIETCHWPSGCDAFHGLEVRVGSPAAPRPAAAPTAGAAAAIDHVVVHSPDLERAIALWRDRLGVRLALDQEFPSRGLRMCFFRSGDITLEFVSTLPAPAGPPGPDRFQGVAYRVADLGAYHGRLQRAGVDVSPVRPGHKPGTLVATVRSGTAGVPTLLIEDPSRAGAGRA